MGRISPHKACSLQVTIAVPPESRSQSEPVLQAKGRPGCRYSAQREWKEWSSRSGGCSRPATAKQVRQRTCQACTASGCSATTRAARAEPESLQQASRSDKGDADRTDVRRAADGVIRNLFGRGSSISRRWYGGEGVRKGFAIHFHSGMRSCMHLRWLHLGNQNSWSFISR
jgi:hypothetical protein